MRSTRRLPKWVRITLTAVAVWDVVWKGLALWQAAKRRQPAWFVGLLVANTAGILPIGYLVLMRRRDAAAARAQDPWSVNIEPEPDVTRQQLS